MLYDEQIKHEKHAESCPMDRANTHTRARARTHTHTHTHTHKHTHTHTSHKIKYLTWKFSLRMITEQLQKLKLIDICKWLSQLTKNSFVPHCKAPRV